MALILVIDDEEGLRKLMRMALERAGHRVLEAADGRSGHTLFASANPELVITDLFMPGKEGIETIRDMRKSKPGVPILAVSGNPDLEAVSYLRMATALGADHVLPKPFRTSELLSAVEQLLRGSVQAPGA